MIVEQLEQSRDELTVIVYGGLDHFYFLQITAIRFRFDD